MNRKRPKPEWRGYRTSDELEVHNSPSVLAQQCWLYVWCMGMATKRAGFEYRYRDEMAFLLHYIRRGTMSHTFANRTHRVGAGSVYLMSPNRPVRYSIGPNEMSENWWVLLGGRDVAQMMRSLGAEEDPVFRLADVRRFESLFRELMTLTQERPVAYQARSFGVLALMFAELFAVRGKEVDSEVDLVTRRGASLSVPILNAVCRVGRYYNDRLTLRELRSMTNLSLSHFMRQFRHETGMSPMRYVTRYRIEKAKEFLRTTSHPVGEIAHMVGFPDQYNFAHTFRKLTGQSPTQYRANKK